MATMREVNIGHIQIPGRRVLPHEFYWCINNLETPHSYGMKLRPKLPGNVE